MRSSIPMLFMGIGLMISGCQKDEVVAPSPIKSGELSTSAINPINDVTWTLIRMDRGEGSVPMERNAPWFRLGSRPTLVTGFTGCNELTARYEVAGERLAFSSLTHTRRYCADVATLEENYIDVLGHTTNYKLERGMLVLMHGEEALAWFQAR